MPKAAAQIREELPAAAHVGAWLRSMLCASARLAQPNPAALVTRVPSCVVIVLGFVYFYVFCTVFRSNVGAAR